MSNDERNQEIVEKYLEGATATALARTYGLSEPRIRQLLKGVKKPPAAQKRTVISEAHRRLGRKIYDYRFDDRKTRATLATKLGWSQAKLHNLEEGLLDPTLTDLQDLATVLKCNLGELINNVFNRQAS